jgi:hypothetical protein
MKQTAVEWLIENSHIIPKNELNKRELIKQAKEMEKQQIINASNESYFNYRLLKRSVENKKVFSIGEQYYNETFKQQAQ